MNCFFLADLKLAPFPEIYHHNHLDEEKEVINKIGRVPFFVCNTPLSTRYVTNEIVHHEVHEVEHHLVLSFNLIGAILH